MSSFYNDLHEFIWLHRQGFRAVEYVRENDRISMHACGWRANGSGRMKTARDAVAYLEGSAPEQWRQIYCGLTPFLVSDRGNVRLIDGSQPRLFLSNGRYQIAYKPETQSLARRGGRGSMAHKKRVYRSVLVAMAFLDFKKGDEEHEVHHVNGYRTDDRLVNLMVLTHEEHARIHNMGPCGLSTPIDENIQAADKLEEITPIPKLKKRRLEKRALQQALSEPSERESRCAKEEDTKPDREAITPVDPPAGMYVFAPLPKIGDLGTFETEEVVEIAQAKEKAGAQCPVNDDGGKDDRQESAANVESEDARGEHAAQETSSLKAAEQAGRDAVREQLDCDMEKSAAETHEDAKEEKLSRSAKRRRSRKRKKAEAAKAAQNEVEGAQSDVSNAKEATPDGKDEDVAQPTPQSAANEHVAENSPKAKPAKDSAISSTEDEKATCDEAGQKPWSEKRDRLEHATQSYTQTVDEHLDSDEEQQHRVAKTAAKAIYKAYDRILACPDEIYVFDALLSTIRVIATHAEELSKAGREIPKTTRSLLGQLSRGLKLTTHKLMAQGDIVASCTLEVLVDEGRKSRYEVFGRGRSPLQRSINVARAAQGKAEDAQNDTSDVEKVTIDSDAGKRTGNATRKNSAAEHAA